MKCQGKYTPVRKKHLPAEMKLSIDAGPDVRQQAAKYCNDDEIVLDSKTERRIQKSRIHKMWCMVVDTEAVFLYNLEEDDLEKIWELNDLKSKEDLYELRMCIKHRICDG